MRRIASNSAAAAAAGGRSTLLLLLLFVTDHLQSSLGSIESTTIIDDPKYNGAHPEDRELLRNVDVLRKKTSASIMDFKFNVNRIRVLSKSVDIPEKNDGIIYWMTRDHRVQDNWALLYAQKLAIENKVALYVVFCRPNIVVDMSYRQYRFMCEGLKRVEVECQTLNIGFNFLIGNSTEAFLDFVRIRSPGSIIVDFSPLRDEINMLNQLVHAIGSEVPVIQVDAHNIVPCWILADKQIRNPESFRIRMHEKRDEYITEFPPVIKHPYNAFIKARPTDWQMAFSNLQIDRSVKREPHFYAGYIPAMRSLNSFLKKKLAKYYSHHRRDPLTNGLSNLSPWLHFGQISAQRVLLEVLRFNGTYLRSVNTYQAEILIRRELLEHFCYYNPNYDNIKGGPTWGQETLNAHRNDTRERVYTRQQFENSQTGDLLWNAANNQMKKDGKTHRFLRPFWAKKILEFSKTPEEAIATANYLNNKYSLDGNDPSGFGGILWAITGLYDLQCKESPIFGKVRYVDTLKLRNKFNAIRYISRFEGYRVSSSKRTN